MNVLLIQMTLFRLVESRLHALLMYHAIRSQILQQIWMALWLFLNLLYVFILLHIKFLRLRKSCFCFDQFFHKSLIKRIVQAHIQKVASLDLKTAHISFILRL